MKKFKKYYKLFLKNKFLIIVFVIFLFELFLRTYQLDFKNPFGYDQVDNAWVAKNLIVNQKYPFVGMVAKTSSGIFIGPLYYYFISFFYWIFNLNPIASQIAGVISNLFTFGVIFYVTKKLFSKEVVIIALLLNTFNFHVMIFDTVQWPVQLLPSVSFIIFYLLYKVITGDVKKLIFLAITVGIAFNLHFTAIFFPIIIILSLPFFPRNKETLKYIFLSLPFFIIWLVPNIIYSLTNKTANPTATSYFSTYYHGFHLRRVVQIAGDGLIQFNSYSFLDKLTPLKFIAVPLFFLLYLYKSISRKKLIFCYLVLLWFVAPWFVFATYSGEISDYYFSINRFIALLIISYFFARVWMINNIIPKLVIIIVLFCIAVISVIAYLPYKDAGLAEREKTVLDAIEQGRRIGFQQGVPESYLYYYFMRQKGVDVYDSKEK